MIQDSDTLVADVLQGARQHTPDAPFQKWLWASPASGGDFFLDKVETALRRDGRRWVRIHLPAYSLDAPEHLLGQLCQHLDRTDARDFEATRSVSGRIRDIARPLGRERDLPLFLLRIPETWLQAPHPHHPSTDTGPAALRAFLNSDLPAVVVSTQQDRPLQGLFGSRTELAPLEAGDDFLQDATHWGTLIDHAVRLAAIRGPRSARARPLDLQLAVGCLVLGATEDDVSGALDAALPTQALLRLFASSAPDEQEWKTALRRVALCRFPLPVDVVRALLPDSDEIREIVLRCLGQPDTTGLRFHEALRPLAALAEERPDRDPEAHRLLADHYRSIDGAPTAREAVRRAIPWLEHNHHLGRAGRQGWDDLQARPVLSTMSRYAVAWSLSVEFEEFELAATIYRSLAQQDDRDAYSHHYWAWNLDRAGRDGPTALREYRRAVELDPTNAWYHSRLITFLIGSGFQGESREAFRNAMRSLSARPEARRANLPFHLHIHVTRAALDVGDLILARDALEAVTPDQAREASFELAKLRLELESLEEIDRLGEALYPSTVPVAQRWSHALLLPERILVEDPTQPGQLRSAALQRFYPGRVLWAEEGEAARLLLADPTVDPPHQFTLETSHAELTRSSGGQPPEPGRFLELGLYDNDHQRVAYHPRTPYSYDRDEFLHSLRYLRNAPGEEEP